jgi:hypothetical protein
LFVYFALYYIDVMNKRKIILTTVGIFFLSIQSISQSILPQVILTNLDAVNSASEADVVVDGALNEIYNDTIF